MQIIFGLLLLCSLDYVVVVVVVVRSVLLIVVVLVSLTRSKV